MDANGREWGLVFVALGWVVEALVTRSLRKEPNPK